MLRGSGSPGGGSVSRKHILTTNRMNSDNSADGRKVSKIQAGEREGSRRKAFPANEGVVAAFNWFTGNRGEDLRMETIRTAFEAEGVEVVNGGGHTSPGVVATVGPTRKQSTYLKNQQIRAPKSSG